jgi:cytochrome oxidase assembly protein ShyY1
MRFKKFNPGKKITIFFIFFATTFFLLGIWQVERGHDKSKIIEEFNNNSKKIHHLYQKSRQNGTEYLLKGSGKAQSKY